MQNDASLECLIFRPVAISLSIGGIDDFNLYQVSLYMFDLLGKLVTYLTAFGQLCVLISVIENLPMEMRERLTEMREMDLQVQSKSEMRGIQMIIFCDKEVSTFTLPTKSFS